MKAAALKRRRRVARDDGPDPIDVFVGKRLRERRRLAGVSQHELGKRLGVSFQAVQKYEAAEIRLAASTLYRLCQVFSVPPGYFFEGYGAKATNRKKARTSRRSLKGRVSVDGEINGRRNLATGPQR